MQDVLLFLASFAGGLFLGYLAAVLTFFVVQLGREGVENPRAFAIPALALLLIFGTALGYVAIVVLDNWPVFFGAAISFIYAARPLFKPSE